MGEDLEHWLELSRRTALHYMHASSTDDYQVNEMSEILSLVEFPQLSDNLSLSTHLGIT